MSDDYENEDDLVQYTVELYKKGEPLGITITGSEDSRLPISIQELSPGKIITIKSFIRFINSGVLVNTFIGTSTKKILILILKKCISWLGNIFFHYIKINLINPLNVYIS